MSASITRITDATPSIDAKIGRRVHQLMWDRQMSQTEFAALSGMDQSSVAKRTRGKLGWNAAQLVTAAGILDTTVAYLVGETEESGPNPRPVHSLPSNPKVASLRSEPAAALCARVTDIRAIRRRDTPSRHIA